MDDGVNASVMEICAAAMFRVCALPSDIAVNGEEEIAVVMMIVKA